MLRGLALLGLLSLFACADPEVLFIEQPSTSDRGAILLALIDPSRVELRAFESDDRFEVPYPSAAADTRLELLSYSVSLAELGLSPGLVRLATRDEPSHPLPTPNERFVLGPTSTDRDWEKRPGLSAELGNLRLPGAPPSLCDELERHVVYPENLQVGTGAESVVRLSNEKVMLSFPGGELRLISFDLANGVTPLSSAFGNHRPFELDEDGTFWLGTRTTSVVDPRFVLLAQARLEGDTLVSAQDFRFADPSLTGLRKTAVTGRAPSGRPTRFLLDRTGAVLHFDGEELRLVHRFSPSLEGLGDLEVRSPGEVFGVWDADDGLFVIDEGGGTTLSASGLDPNQGNLVLARDEDGSLLIADYQGTFYRLDPGGLVTELGRGNGETHQYTAILPFAGGFVVGGKRGVLKVYQPEIGFCDLSHPEIPGAVNDIVPFGTGFLLAVDVGEGEAARIVYFTAP